MAYRNTDLLFHRSVCQKSNGLSWFPCSMSAKPCEVVGRAAFFVEALERSLLDWFTLLAELISMQLWNWEPCFSAGCGWVSWSVSRGLLHTFVLGLYPHSQQWWVESSGALKFFLISLSTSSALTSSLQYTSDSSAFLSCFSEPM